MNKWLDKYDDSIIAQGGETIPSSREIPEITVYGKKNYLQELDKQQQKYLADMAKYKKDSAVYQSYQDSLNLYTDVLDMANSEQNTYWNTRKKEIIDNYKRVAKGETVEYWKKAKAESKDADKSWYDQMIKKSIDQQKYYSNPKNIDKAIQDETKKHYNAFNIGTAYQLKTATNKNSNRYDYPDDGYFYTNMIRANNSSDREYKEYLNHFIKYRESKLKDAIKSGKSQVSVSGMASTNIPGAKSEISNAKKLKKLLSSDIKPVGYTDSPESLRYPIYKKPVAEPPIATKPIGTNVKYDPTYENLRMRPLWATMAKQDTTSKIGTLNLLDPLYEKGFTYGEAQKFPEEIRRQYKLDYPIYEDGGTIPKAQEGKTVRDFLHKAIGVPLALNQFGYDLLGGDASITEKSLTDNELTTLRKVTRNVLKEGKKTIGYDDYSKEFGKDVFEAIYNSSIKERIKDLKDPSYNLAFTLGNSAINISGNDTIINDRYNFNQRVEPKEFGKELLQGNYNIKDNPYFFIQDIGHTFGSKEGEGSPIKINISQKRNGGMIPLYAEGGSMSYTPEYIEQLKQFENRHDNLAYHLDNKKIPTIGWGHRITEEELKRKAIKMGKEWIPYEKFSGKEGRQYADRLMELDVAHHYNRLEKQVGRDTLATLPPELHDVLLDITYNRGSLGDSLEYVKKGDIPGLKNYLADVSKGLKGGAKTRMEWRANRIPLTTPAPVQVPLYDTPQNSYVPEVLQNIVQDNEGYRNPENYGKPVQIVSNQSTTPISMQGVPFPILAMSDTGELKIMMPGEEHEFEGGSVTELPIAQEGASIRSDDRNWLQRFNDKVYSGYQEHKPQLFKDFPITDIVEPVVSYLTGHSDPDTGLMNILPGANLPNKYYRRLTEGQISKAIREKGLITPTLKEKGLTVTKSFPKKGQYVLELSTNKPVSANPLSISYGKTHPSQTYSFPDIVDLQSGNMKMFRRLNKKLIEVDPKLYGAPSKEALIDKQVIESMSPASGSLPYHHYAGEETLLSPHKIYKGGQNPPQLSLDRDYIYGIEKFKRNKSKIHYADPSRSDEVSSPHIVNDYKSPSYVNLYDNFYYASTEPSANSLTPLAKNIQKYIGTFSDEISPQFRSPQMINSVRSYYKNHFGEDVSMLSNEDISKFIQKSYNESGAKGVLYHSTNRPMTEYNPNYPTEERINPGWLGEGTYFADIPSQDYGLLQEPFIHSGIEKKVIINDIRDFKKPTVRFTSPQIEVDNLLKKISKPIVRKDKGGLSYEGNPTAFGVGKNREIWNKFIKDKQVDAIYSATSTKGVGMNWPEIIIPPSSSVNLRSLYPHPELIKSSLNKGRLNRDWSNPMINYEDGGNIKKSKQLRTFTEDNGWLNKYKEL